ncbi:hypothetical protein V1511DRAFT_499688 [Dipodascopsis uninucleata]
MTTSPGINVDTINKQKQKSLSSISGVEAVEGQNQKDDIEFQIGSKRSLEQHNDCVSIADNTKSKKVKIEGLNYTGGIDDINREIEELFGYSDSVHDDGMTGMTGMTEMTEQDAALADALVNEMYQPSEQVLTPPYGKNDDISVKEQLNLMVETSDNSHSESCVLPTPSPPPSSVSGTQEDLKAADQNLSSISVPAAASPVQARASALYKMVDVHTISSNIADIKSKIMSFHSLMTTYSALKSAYTQVCLLSKNLKMEVTQSQKKIMLLESRNRELVNRLEKSNRDVDHLKSVIRALPDQGTILRKMASLESEVQKKSQELAQLKAKCKDDVYLVLDD